MNLSLIIGISLIIICGIFIYIFKPSKTYTRYGIITEHFKAKANLTNQAPMNFNYLTNRNYARDILATYYLDDDKKINGNRVVNHPYMYSYGSNNNYGYFWRDPLTSDYGYKKSGVRL